MLRSVLLLLALLLPTGAVAQLRVNGYQTRSLHGFDVLVEEIPLTQTHPQQMQAALDELDAQLTRILASDLTPEALEALRAVKIFVDWQTTTGAAQYHPSRQWLIENGYEPEKERSVEISNAVNFVAWSQQNQPWMVLHELAHALHHQVLGYEHPATIAAYTHALETGLLGMVPYNPGGGRPHVPAPSYAASNEREYFAEITEAYFGENDFYPFVRVELETYDPQGFALIASTWFSFPTSAEGIAPSSPVEVFPNPTRDAVTVLAPEASDIVVMDLVGRVVLRASAERGPTRLDLRGLTPGAYFVRASGVTRRLVRIR